LPFIATGSVIGHKLRLKLRASIGLFVWLLTSVAIAHLGGLDANGGHTDNKTGEHHDHKKRGTNSPTTETSTNTFRLILSCYEDEK